MRFPMTRPRRDPSTGAPPSGGADEAVTSLCLAYYRPLVRFATLLLPDPAVAEDIVEDSFAAVRSASPGTLGADDALGYLLQSVIWRCRPARRKAARTEHSAFASALSTLPARHREILALRYFAELSGTQAMMTPGPRTGWFRRRTRLSGHYTVGGTLRVAGRPGRDCPGLGHGRG